MLKEIATQIVQELSVAIKSPFIVSEESGQIIAAAQCKDKHLTVEKVQQQGWLEGKIIYKNKVLGSVWLRGKRKEDTIYLELLQNLVRERYKENLSSQVKGQEEILKDVLTGKFEEEKVQAILEENSLNLGDKQHIFIIDFKKEKPHKVLTLLNSFWPIQGANGITLNSEQVVWVIDTGLVEESVEQLALTIQQLLLDELYIECVIGISGPANYPSELNKIMQQAQEALKLKKLFDLKMQVLNYHKLNLYIFLASLPNDVLQSVHKTYAKEWQQIADDAELNFTLEKILEHKLNLSEAARELFIHRNTLLYRLEKLQKLTGLDFKNFDDIILLRLLMLLYKL